MQGVFQRFTELAERTEASRLIGLDRIHDDGLDHQGNCDTNSFRSRL